MSFQEQSIDEEWMSFITSQSANTIQFGIECNLNKPPTYSKKNTHTETAIENNNINTKKRNKCKEKEKENEKEKEKVNGSKKDTSIHANKSDKKKYDETISKELEEMEEEIDDEIDDDMETYGELEQEIDKEYNKKHKNTNKCINIPEQIQISKENFVPDCDELYISTKTKVVFLNHEIDIHSVFWNIPIIEYWKPEEGIIKKQMKIVSNSPEEYELYKKKLENIGYYTENIIKQVDSRNKYKDERKITVGVSKKDIMNCRGKIKNAFYNCFAIILRFYYEDTFKEIHVKVFNTGKMEIPGVFNLELLNIVKSMVLRTIQPFVKEELTYIETNKDDNVLINSNFNCGFYINREKLHSILKRKYGIETSFDPCSYPGVKCKFYFNNEKSFNVEEQIGKIMKEDCSMKMSELGENKKYTEVSFMIFRTGSCLIVGNCSEKILKFIFEFVKKILLDEYENICIANEKMVAKVKKTKIRKRTITLSRGYHETISTKT